MLRGLPAHYDVLEKEDILYKMREVKQIYLLEDKGCFQQYYAWKFSQQEGGKGRQNERF